MLEGFGRLVEGVLDGRAGDSIGLTVGREDLGSGERSNFDTVPDGVLVHPEELGGLGHTDGLILCHRGQHSR
jgi:hypothetical protein